MIAILIIINWSSFNYFNKVNKTISPLTLAIEDYLDVGLFMFFNNRSARLFSIKAENSSKAWLAKVEADVAE